MSTELQIRITYGLSHERNNPIFIATKIFIISNGTVAHKKYHSMKILQIRSWGQQRLNLRLPEKIGNN